MSKHRGGAGLALPLLLGWALASSAWAASSSMSSPLSAGSLTDGASHVDFTSMILSARPEAFDDVPKALGYPVTGANVTLYGGGATFDKGQLRFGVQALVGGLSARDGGLATEWHLSMGNVIMEQRYLMGPVEATAGSMICYVLTEGLLQDNEKITRFDAQSYGGGAVAGARWPRDTQLGFMLRGGYLWMPVSGTWKGNLAGSNLKSALDLGGPFAQAQVELSF